MKSTHAFPFGYSFHALALSASFALFILGSTSRAETSEERVKKRFQSENYTTTWGNPATYDPNTELEIGFSSGHGGTLGWLRFQPGKEKVRILSIELNEGRQPYHSKWPPDRVPVTVKLAELKIESYTTLLSELSIVGSASLKPVKTEWGSASSDDFWVYARLTTNKQIHLELNWAGYAGNPREFAYAKPMAAVSLAREVVGGLDSKLHELTNEERDWVSSKFAAEWDGLNLSWWVRERYIQTVGVAGNKAALPLLMKILSAEQHKGTPAQASDDRCVYHAINAATRLTAKDVREKPVEEMDIGKTRAKVLALINDNN